MNGKKVLLILIAVTEWFALPAQFILHMQSSTVSPLEAVMRYFGYFTILTNLLVCLYVSAQLFSKNRGPSNFFFKPSVETGITLYIVVVGLIYNIILRNLWDSTGLQAVLHDFLHTVSPLLMLILWFRYIHAKRVSFRDIPTWLLFPAGYTIITLFRGYFVSWYPYPFFDLNKFGIGQVAINSLMLLIVFSIFAATLVLLGNRKAVPSR